MIVMRGYPHSVINNEAFNHPVGLFQKRQIERHLSAEGKSVKAWMTLGEEASRPVRPENPAFLRVRRLVTRHRCPIATDNVLRLFDGATRESAEALTSFLVERKLPLISLVHGQPVHLNRQLFPLLLADRLNAITQADALAPLRKELGLARDERPPKARSAIRKKARQQNWVVSNLALLDAIDEILKDRGTAPERSSIADLCAALNERDHLTETGVPWTTHNLRKKLKRLRDHLENAEIWDRIAL